jgi:hypothetical protein
MPTPTLSPARRLIAAIDELMAGVAPFYFQPGRPLRWLNEDERKWLFDLEGQILGLVAIVAGGRIPFDGRPATSPKPPHHTSATGLPYTMCHLGISITKNSVWEAKLRTLRAAVQAVIASEESSGPTDNKADTVIKRKKRPLKNLKELLDLKKALARGARHGQTRKESALEFTDGDERKAHALLRSLGRNRDRPELS